MRTLLLLLVSVLLSCEPDAQPPPASQGPPPPPDPTWARTAGHHWNSYACPDGSVVFSAHLGGPRSLFHSEASGEVAVTREEVEGDSRWAGGAVVVRHEPERRMRVTVGGEEIGGGACVQDRQATLRDRVEGLAGLWVVDARLNPKPGRVGLRIPGMDLPDGTPRALFVGEDRVRLRPKDIGQAQTFASQAPGRVDLGLGLGADAYEAITALQERHAAQPLALLADGVLISELDIVSQLVEERVVAAGGLDEDQLGQVQAALQTE